MFKVYWQLNGEQLSEIVTTKDEAVNLCQYFDSRGCYHEVFFEEQDD